MYVALRYMYGPIGITAMTETQVMMIRFEVKAAGATFVGINSEEVTT